VSERDLAGDRCRRLVSWDRDDIVGLLLLSSASMTSTPDDGGHFEREQPKYTSTPNTKGVKTKPPLKSW
jgi:hypothetical protein